MEGKRAWALGTEVSDELHTLERAVTTRHITAKRNPRLAHYGGILLGALEAFNRFWIAFGLLFVVSPEPILAS